MATVIDVDVTGVEASGGGGSVDPPKGVLPCRIAFAEKRTEKNDGTPANDIRVALDFGGDYQWKFTYIGLGPESDWKLAEFIRALGLKDKVKLDLDKIKGKMLRAKLNPETYEGEPTTKVGRLMKAQPDDVLPEATEDRGEEPSANGNQPTASGGGYPEGYTPEREDPDGEVGSYDDWSDEDVAGEVEDRGLTIAGGRGKKRDKQVAALRADDAEPLDDEAAVGSDEAEAHVGEDDYDEWIETDLEEEAKERELDLPKRGRGPKAAEPYMEALVALLRKDDEDNPFDPNAK